MHQILKRLEIIKSSIAIEDEEIIGLQCSKLDGMELDDDVRAIISTLSQNDYAQALVLIEAYVARYSGVVVYEDKEIGALKLELKVLESKLQELSATRSEYLNDINEFNTVYNIRLGDIIRKILNLKKTILYEKINQHTDDDKEDTENIKELKKEYEEVKSDYEEFNREYEEVVAKDRYELDEAEQAELKQLFRRSCKLCHPDIVADELRDQAHEIMAELNEAYDKKDLKKVRQILEALESGSGFDIASDKINDKELLRAKINDIRQKIDETEQEIEAIKQSKIYKIIQEITDMDEYFERMRAELEQECERLKEQSVEKPTTDNVKDKNSDDKSTPMNDEDDFWSSKF